MLRTDQQVKTVIKCIKKADSILAVHLSNTPIISTSRKIQSYIRSKLGTGYILQPTTSTVRANELMRE